MTARKQTPCGENSFTFSFSYALWGVQEGCLAPWQTHLYLPVHSRMMPSQLLTGESYAHAVELFRPTTSSPEHTGRFDMLLKTGSDSVGIIIKNVEKCHLTWVRTDSKHG